MQHRLVAFDLDGTLAEGVVYVWKLLHEHFGTDPARRRAAHDAYFSGRLSYAGWFGTDLELLAEKGAHRAALLAALHAVRPALGALEVLQHLRAQGRIVAVISGSVDLLLEHLFPQFRFDHVLINRLHFAADGRLIGGEPTPYDMERKADGLAELARRAGLRLTDCAFCGDNENDLQVLGAAGLGIAVNPRTARVVAAADRVLEGSDLRGLLPLLASGA